MKQIKTIIISGGGILLMSCIGLAAAVISDLRWLQGLCFLTGALAFLCMIVSTLVAFCMRKFWAGLMGIGVIALSLVFTLFTVVLIGAGQHHPPKHYPELDEVPDTCAVVEEVEEP